MNEHQLLKYANVYKELAETETTMVHKNMNKHIVCIFGASGSGKDTAGSYLERNHKFLGRKFARPMKEFVETQYNLKPGTLDTQEGKAQLLYPGSDKTFADLLVGAYHFWQQFDDAMTARNVAKDIEELVVNTPWNVVLTDVRKICEALLLRNIVWEHENDEHDPDVKLHIVCIGGRGQELSSDSEQKECLNILKDCCWSIQYLDNKFSKEYFLNLVDNFAVTEIL